MYDEREIKISPAMYVRWLIKQSNPNLRRNVQFIFNSINNKDIKAVDSGVFASIRTTKLPNMNVKKLREVWCRESYLTTLTRQDSWHNSKLSL